MAYETPQLKADALKAIEQYNLYFFEDVCAYIGIHKSTFYDHFPTDSDDYNAIKDALQRNKIRTKISLRAKLHNSNSPTGWLALYKLLCTEDERRRLAMEYHEHTSQGEALADPVRIVIPDNRRKDATYADVEEADWEEIFPEGLPESFHEEDEAPPSADGDRANGSS